MRLAFTDIRTKSELPLIEHRIAEFTGWPLGSFDVVRCTFADGGQRVCVDYPTDLTEDEASEAIKENLDNINAPAYRTTMRPYIDEHSIFIPANEKGILPEYQDPVIRVAGHTLKPAWGWPRGGYRWLNSDGPPDSDLAIVKLVFRRNRKANPLSMEQHILDVMGVETLAEAWEKMRNEYTGRSFHDFIMSMVFDFHVLGEDVADFYGDEEADYEKYTNHIFRTISQ